MEEGGEKHRIPKREVLPFSILCISTSPVCFRLSNVHALLSSGLRVSWIYGPCRLAKLQEKVISLNPRSPWYRNALSHGFKEISSAYEWLGATRVPTSSAEFYRRGKKKPRKPKNQVVKLSGVILNSELHLGIVGSSCGYILFQTSNLCAILVLRLSLRP